MTTRPAGGWRAAVAPSIVAATAATSLAAVAVVDPNVPGAWPVCPSWSVLGVLCPLCGGLRSAHALTELDLATAVGANAFVPLIVLAAAIGWLAWVRRLRTGQTRRSPTMPRWLLQVTGGVVVVYTVLRNLPGFEVLAP